MVFGKAFRHEFIKYRQMESKCSSFGNVIVANVVQGGGSEIGFGTIEKQKIYK